MRPHAVLALAVVVLFSIASPLCHAQTGGREQGLGVQDGFGNFYSVTARSGPNAYFQVTKMTLTGAWLWNVQYNPRPDLDVTAQAINVDREGDFIIAGTQAGDRHRNLLVVKYTKLGALYWDQVFDRYDAGANVIPSVLATDRDGNIYVASTIWGRQGGAIQVVRYNTAGAFFWSREYRNGRSNYARAIVIDLNGDAHVTVDISIDTRSHYYQTREVVFTVDGGVVQQ